MLWPVIFILIFPIVWSASNLQCLDCSQKLRLSSSETINTTRPDCLSVDAEYASCSQLLHVQYTEKKEALVTFQASPRELLVLSNAAQMMTNTTMIWLDKHQFERTFQIFCFNDNTCKPDTIRNIYAEVQHFGDWGLTTKLASRLYDTIVKPEERVCADNQDKPVPCPYGYCQLTSSDSSSFSRSCVHNSSIPDPYGVILESKTISEAEIESSVKYTCNIPMCNNSTMAKQVRRFLEDHKLLTYSITTTTTTITTTTTTKITATTAAKRSTGNIPKSMISMQCALVFLMTFIFH